MSKLDKVVTIDGHRGTGKSRLANDLREFFDCGVFEVGPLFRFVAWLVQTKRIEHLEEACTVLDKLIESESLQFLLDRGCGISASLVAFEGRVINDELWLPSLDQTLRTVAADPEIIECVVRTSRRIVDNQKCIVVGREVGTQFFPDASIKILLEAKERSRTQRKLSQLARKGAPVNASYRLNSSEPPMDWTFVKDGVVLDSTGITPDQMLALVVPILRESLGWVPSNGFKAKHE